MGKRVRPPQTWKKVELRIARAFGTTRTPLSGGASKHTRSDTLHPFIYCEIKHGKTPLVQYVIRNCPKGTRCIFDDGTTQLIAQHVDDMITKPKMKVKLENRGNIMGLMMLYMHSKDCSMQEGKVPILCIHGAGETGFIVLVEYRFYPIIQDILNKVTRGWHRKEWWFIEE